jgi:hypothetical protein
MCLLWVADAAAQAPASPAGDFEIRFPTPTPSEAGNYKIMPPEYQERLREAVTRVNAVWRSDTFNNQILGSEFQHYGENKDRSPEQVIDTINATHPKKLTYYLCANAADALASTNQDTEKTCVYDAYMQGEGTRINALVNTISHEFTHTISGGYYQHPSLSTGVSRFFGIGRHRDMTVPYAVGNIAEGVAEDQFPVPPVPRMPGPAVHHERLVMKDIVTRNKK